MSAINAPTITMLVIAISLFVYGSLRGRGEQIQGIQTGLRTLLSIAPMLLLSFLVMGMLMVLMPRDVAQRWLSEAAGWRAVVIGAVAGVVAPGGPTVGLPIVAGMIKTGAGVGAMVAFLTGSSICSLYRVPIEVSILGWRLALVRLGAVILLPVAAGSIAHILSRFAPGTQ